LSNRDMRFWKAATCIRQKHDKHAYVFGEEEERRCTLSDVYTMSLILANELMEFNANGRDIVVIGRLTKFSCAAFLACTLIGSTSCCVDAKLNSKFYSLDFSYKTIIIDAAYLKEKLVIPSRPGLELVFIYGSNEATNKVTVIDEAGTGR